ncbi:unnamed protein product [Triticum turgidum subsp. durum]|uniref:Uncharacterized protein n=1 Tax=Triticum turgidum subsp. durum TaxID=4567 RepID=A0A9R0ZLU1_TRITD|nr:unnamed protein product [Triticum turgidum subsp. durum]
MTGCLSVNYNVHYKVHTYGNLLMSLTNQRNQKAKREETWCRRVNYSTAPRNRSLITRRSQPMD